MKIIVATDLGMLTVPAEILSKPGALTQEERWQVQHHAIAGAMMLRGLGGRLDEAATVVHHHHERFDGTGYPGKLAGERIPIASRIVAVAEALDTMVNDQPYRHAYPAEFAVAPRTGGGNATRPAGSGRARDALCPNA